MNRQSRCLNKTAAAGSYEAVFKTLENSSLRIFEIGEVIGDR